MTHRELMIEADMLQGNINRMLVTKNPKELQKMHEIAEYRLQKIHCAKVIELNKVEEEE